MFLLPFAAFFALSFLIPIGMSVRASFYRDRPVGGGLYAGGKTAEAFAGFGNYEAALHRQEFWAGLGRVVLLGAFQIPVMIGAALTVALIIDSGLIRRPTLFRLGVFLPYAVPGVVAALVWTYIYSPELSPINQALGHLGTTVDFFAPRTVLVSIANMTTWTFTGYNMLVFLAALQAIPRELYEAAKMDGASEWDVVRRVKVPLVGRAMLLAILLSIIGTIQLFNEPTVMAAVNPSMGHAYTPMMMAYNTMTGALSPSGAGPASALSILMALVAAGLAFAYTLIQRRSLA
ncbi:sugar ABC transporter permease [Pedococcus sp.]|uniref:carbohydrate ABC transporter permease n=1 Tax=Pedococcus sp. TaxID=2860345 RepID=UPI002E0D8159|nr:sugar ABC transporter permease [Pedococcus sp.]